MRRGPMLRIRRALNVSASGDSRRLTLTFRANTELAVAEVHFVIGDAEPLILDPAQGVEVHFTFLAMQNHPTLTQFK